MSSDRRIRPSSRLLWIMTAGLGVAAVPAFVGAAYWPVTGAFEVAILACISVDLAVLLRARPEVQVGFPHAVGVGSALDLAVTIRHRSARSLAVRLRAEVQLPLEALADTQAWLPPGSSTHAVPIRADRRGTARVASVWLRLRGPLGVLFHQMRSPVADGEIRVLPNVAHVRRFALEHFGAWQYKGGLRIARQAGDGTELDALEAYQPGMDLRNVDWKVSARYQALRVRRYRLEQNQRLVLSFDVGRLMGDPIDNLTRLDHAIHAGLLVTYAALRAGDLVGLHAYAGTPVGWVPPAVGHRRLRGIVDACATLSPATDETNHVLGLHDLLSRIQRRSLVLVFSEFADSTTAELMVENLGHLAQRHLVVFVAFDDPTVAAPLARVPRSVQDLAGAVVAGGLRQDRERVLRRLRRSGVHVVHGPPTHATLEALASYVRIKRRGLIG